MPSYSETLKNTAVFIWTRISTHYSHPIRFFVAKQRNNTTTSTSANANAYATPYVWSREFLQESGFDLSSEELKNKMPALLAVRQIPGVVYSDSDDFKPKPVGGLWTMPPSVVLGVLVNWLGGLLRMLVEGVCGLGVADLPWILLVGGAGVVVYRWRAKIGGVVAELWGELEEDVAVWIERQFPSMRYERQTARYETDSACHELPVTRQELRPVYKELPPGMTTISTETLKSMHLSADAIQRRINRLRMSKFNYVRSRTGVLFNMNTFSKVQAQLTEAQEALRKEQSKGSRPLAKFLRSRRIGVVSVRTQQDLKLKQELDDLQAEFNVLEDSRDTWKEAFEALEKQADVKAVQNLQDNTQEDLKLNKQNLDDLQAEFKVVEDSRDTWKEAFEALEKQADVKAVQDLRDKITSDGQHNARRIEALEIQLEIERTNRQEAQTVARDLRTSQTTLQGQLREAKASNESGELAYQELDAMHSAEETANEEKGQEIENLKADIDRLQRELREAKTSSQSAELAYQKLHAMHSVDKSANEERSQVIKNLKANINRLQGELRGAKASNESFESANEEKSQVIENLKADIDRLQGELREAKATNEDTELANHLLDAIHSTDKGVNEEKSQEIDNLKADLDRLQGDLREAKASNESVELAYQELDHMHSTEESANKAKSQEIENLKADIDRLQAALTASNAPHQGLDTERDDIAATGPTEVPGETWQAYPFPSQQPQASSTVELAPLRQIQSASLWLPPPHHGDSFDPMYGVSDYGDNEEEEHTENRSSHGVDDTSVPNAGEGPSKGLDYQDETQGEGSIVGGDHAQASESSSHKETFIMNVSAPPFIPSPPANTHEPDFASFDISEYLAAPMEDDDFGISNYNIDGSFTFSEDVVLPDATPQLDFLQNMQLVGVGGDSLIADPVYVEQAFPEIDFPEPTPAPRAAGPSQTRNPHIQKLNQEVKRLDWRRKSGMPDSVDEEEGIAGPSEVLDDMYDRQVSQCLSPSPNRFSRGSMWGALNDISDALENPSLPSTPPGSTLASHQSRRSEEQETPVKVNRDEENAPQQGTGSGVLMLGRYEVTRGEPPASTDSGAPKEEDESEKDGDSKEEAVDGVEEKEDEKSKKDVVEAQKAEEEPSNNSQHSSPLTPPEQIQLQQDVTTPMPASQSPTLTNEPSASVSATNEAPLPVTQEQIDAVPSIEAVQAKPAAARPPSNYWAGIENAEQTHDEAVGEAISDVLEDLAKKRPLRTLAQSRWAQKPTTATKIKAVPEKVPSSQVTQGQIDAVPNAEVVQDKPAATHPPSQDRPAATRPPSNYWAGIENAERTHDEVVGDAIVDVLEDLAKKRPLRTLAQSRWAQKPTTSTKTKTVPEKVPSSQVTQGQASDQPQTEVVRPEQPGPRRPSNYFPGSENATKTHDEEVGDALAQSVQECASISKTLANSTWTNKSDASSKSTTQQSSSKAGENVKQPQAPSQSGIEEVARTPLGYQGARVERGLGSSRWSRGNASGHGRGGHEPQFLPASTPSPAPIHTPTSQTPRSNGTPRGPGNQTPGTGNRTFGMFPEGRGNDRRPDRGGPSAPASATREVSSRSAVEESFRRLQERMNGDLAEDKNKEPHSLPAAISSPATTQVLPPKNPPRGPSDQAPATDNRGTGLFPKGDGNDRRPETSGPSTPANPTSTAHDSPSQSAVDESFRRWQEQIDKMKSWADDDEPPPSQPLPNTTTSSPRPRTIETRPANDPPPRPRNQIPRASTRGPRYNPRGGRGNDRPRAGGRGGPMIVTPESAAVVRGPAPSSQANESFLRLQARLPKPAEEEGKK